MKILLSITLIPLFAGFSLSAFGYGGNAQAIQQHQNQQRRQAQQRRNTRNLVDALSRKDQEIRNLKKELKQYKDDYFKVYAFSKALNKECRANINYCKREKDKIMSTCNASYDQRISDALSRKDQEIGNLKGELSKRYQVIDYLERELKDNCQGTSPRVVSSTGQPPAITDQGYSTSQAHTPSKSVR